MYINAPVFFDVYFEIQILIIIGCGRYPGGRPRMTFAQTLWNFQKIILAISCVWLCVVFESISILTKTPILPFSAKLEKLSSNISYIPVVIF